MSQLIAVLQFLFSLCGVQMGGTSFSDRISIDGSDTLYSKAYVEAGSARFACVTSTSGACHYTLFGKDCPPTPGANINGPCVPRPLKRFVVPSGDSKQITGLPAFGFCVGTGDATTPNCKVAKRIARR